MRTVLLGKGELAVAILEWFVQSPEHDVLGVVTVTPEPDWTARLGETAQLLGCRYGRPIVTSTESSWT